MRFSTEAKILESRKAEGSVRAEGRTVNFHRKIAVSAEIKNIRDWLRL